MSKKNIIHVYDETFKQNYYLLIGVSRKRYVEIVKKELKLDVELPPPGVCGRVTWVQINDICIPVIWTINKKPSNVAHECFHAVAGALDDRGIKLSEDTSEVYAYSIERLMRAALS